MSSRNKLDIQQLAITILAYLRLGLLWGLLKLACYPLFSAPTPLSEDQVKVQCVEAQQETLPAPRTWIMGMQGV